MSTTTVEDTSPRGTRWGRASIPIVAGLALIAAMTGATLTHVLGFEANLRIINSNATNDLNGFSISASRLQAGDVGFGMAPVHQSNGTWKNVLRAGFANATVSGLCLSKTEALPVIGNVTVRLTSPTSAGNITASNGVFDITDLVGDSTNAGFNLKGSTQIGLATTDITSIYANGTSLPYKANPFGSNDLTSGDSALDIWNSSVYAASPGAPAAWMVDGKQHTFGGGWTGIDAGAADLYKVAGRLWQIQLTGQITLPKLNISVTTGTSTCADWVSGVPYTNSKTYP